MDDLNEVRLRGRLTADPLDRETQRGTPMATFSVATNRTFADANGAAQEQTEYTPVVAWGTLARVVEDLHKGDRVEVIGRVRTRSYEYDGRKVYRTEVVAVSVEPLELRTPVVALDE